MNNFNMNYTNEKGNVWNIENTLNNIGEDCFVGRYEIEFTFFNEELKYEIVYHKHLFDTDDRMEVFICDELAEDDIKEYWNDNKLKEIVKRVIEENNGFKVNYILDEMDNYYDYMNEKYKDFADLVNSIINE